MITEAPPRGVLDRGWPVAAEDLDVGVPAAQPERYGLTSTGVAEQIRGLPVPGRQGGGW
jgi:hypothetical protein